MTDVYLEYNGDLVITPDGSIQIADGWDQIRERIVRRFLTNSAIPLPDGTSTPADYVFSPLYGIGAGALIDQNPTADFVKQLTGRMRNAVLLDAAVSPGAVPAVRVSRPQIGVLQVYVTVTLVTGTTNTLSFTLDTSPQAQAIAHPQTGGMIYQPPS